MVYENQKKTINGEMDMKKTLFLLVAGIVALFTFSAVHVSFGGEKTSVLSNKVQTANESYKIGCGDILEIITWKEPDFSEENILVRIDGKITFPLLDEIQAAGRAPIQVKRYIEAKLKKYVENPVVTVTVRQSLSQKFYILGEIARTGEYNLGKNLTVLQAFALAGGFTEWAAKNEIILLRMEDNKEKIIRIKYKDIIKGKDFSQNMRIKADDTIIVP